MMAACGFKPAKMRGGGMVRGPGTGTSDSIPAELPVGSYVVPADSTRRINVSNGEATLTPEQVKAVGMAALEAVRSVTHKKAHKSRGFKRGFADGGPITDDERKQLIAQIPVDTAQAPLPGQVVAGPDTSTELGRNVSNTLSALPGIAPALGAARALAGASSALPSAAGFVSGVGRILAPVAPYAAPAGGALALNAASSAADPAAAPATPVAAATGFRPSVDSQLAADRGAGTPPAAAVPGSSIAGAPGVNKTVGPDGRVTYSNVADDTGLAARGAPSAQNVAAADALSARYASPPASDAVAPRAALTVLPDTGGYGLRDKATLDARNAAVDAAAPMTRSQTQLAITAANNATSRANAQTSAAASKYGVDTGFLSAQQRLALDQQNAGYTNAHTVAQTGQSAVATQQAQAVLAAKLGYAKALQTGDQDKIDAALENARVAEGHFERNYPELKKTQVIPPKVNIDGSTSPGYVIRSDLRTNAEPTITKLDDTGPKDITTDPKAVAIKNNASLSRDEKVKQLKALGY